MPAGGVAWRGVAGREERQVLGQSRCLEQGWEKAGHVRNSEGCPSGERTLSLEITSQAVPVLTH